MANYFNTEYDEIRREQEEYLSNNPEIADIADFTNVVNHHEIYQLLKKVGKFENDDEMEDDEKEEEEEEEKRLVTIKQINEFIVTNPLSFCNTRFENNERIVAEVSPMTYLKGLISNINFDLISAHLFYSNSEERRICKVRDDLMSFKNFYSLARKAKGVILLASKYEGEIVGTLPPEIWHNIFLYLIPE